MHSPRILPVLLLGSVLAACGGSDDDDAPAVTTMACGDFVGKTIAGATVTAATIVPAAASVPEYCSVAATLPTKLKFELRMPTTGWNGKLVYGGADSVNGSAGGFDGFMPVPNVNALKMGYANVASDSGHRSTAPLSDIDATWALDDAEAVANYANLSVPKVAAAAREFVRMRYGSAVTKAYYEGCSNGGREALMVAQRNPDVFDGVIARAPAYNLTGLLTSFQRGAQALAAPGGMFTAGKVATLAGAVRTACDALDGRADGVVGNLTACSFDPAALRCTGADSDACLTDAQVAVVHSWTSDFSLAGTSIAAKRYPLTGNEDDPATWGPWFLGGGGIPSAQYLFMDGGVKYFFAKDPAQDPLTYDLSANVGAAAAFAALADANDALLTGFKARGGKLILWHGTTDPAISVNGTTDYYNRVVTAAGGQAAADGFVRYYKAPGVAHCLAGPGADTADLLSALDTWAGGGAAPATLTALKLDPTNGTTLFSRPLCVHPKYPRYNGRGDVNAAASYTCT
ncbi:hypothetical protein APR50_10985 [Variovorax paradoxus]|uniref:tannase/feruloyl esterase family alpha/beta hydrolase n=1 Tax=Comamonadaceae TaxID=80864 RepID=UPI0006919EC2|nr:tannase/feruloyl esterase family alpha/beta hydrolase [Xenophilus azovorans]KPU99433.1 hypothetical protein APR52_03145 [Variovorax paradoxus]MBN8746434.1 tannase/feruloyl esterase family alpha/beta hydrolase [Variovorax sp.]VTY37040.1 Mono(2-hydroxyethyl) terephthalate hydrolase [Xylophilus ampelinus]KPV02163.1 hypothetical protein APR49_29730 [Variovorax paradoxus]KPV08710.1 hypothetical protein APR50_10985 [Variovorax paradoxus]